MIRVLIADDEKYIRNGLKNAFDWEALGMEVIGAAANGQEALEIARQARPDICMLDICMPQVSGLEFLEQSTAFLDNPVNIIITGYDDFNYARQAVTLSAFDYILKPIDEDALLELLKRAKQEILKRKKKERDFKTTLSLVGKSRHVIRDELIKQLLGNEGDNSEIRSGLALLGVKLMPDMRYLRIFDIKKLDIETSEDKQQREQSARRLRAQLEDALRDNKPFFTCLNADGSITALFCGYGEGVKPRNAIADPIAKLDIRAYFDHVTGYAVHACHKRVNERVENDTRMLPVICRTVEYIREHYAEPMLQLNSLAEQNGMSAGYLAKLFRQETGDTFVKYLSKFRTKIAAELLDETDYKIYEIAEMAGYNSQAYFCEIFKSIMGITPSEYRKRGHAYEGA